MCVTDGYGLALPSFPVAIPSTHKHNKPAPKISALLPKKASSFCPLNPSITTNTKYAENCPILFLRSLPADLLHVHPKATEILATASPPNRFVANSAVSLLVRLQGEARRITKTGNLLKPRGTQHPRYAGKTGTCANPLFS